MRLHRRSFLAASAVAPFASSLASRLFGAEEKTPRKKLPVAAAVTVYRRNSHADVLVGKILEGWRQDGGAGPDLELVSLYVDQKPNGDKSATLAEQHGFRVFDNIADAITLGTDQVQVAGVISVAEHGDYPYTEDTHQHQYPRRRFFDAIADTFERCGKVVPVFNDKHLAWNWADGKHIYDRAKQMKIPLMAGSSVPVAWRKPPLELERGAEIEAVLAVGYGGLESYGFHTIEMLQSLVERRSGGETGVAAITSVQGDALWQAERDGRWSRKLLAAALATMPDQPTDKLEDRISDKAAFYLIDHRDGLKTTVAMANGAARHFCIALKLKGKPEPVATCFYLEDEVPYGHFAYLLHAIEEMIHTGRPSYPVERTLLTTGILDASQRSLAEGGKRLGTPQLDVRYEAADWPFADRVKLG